MISKDEAVSIAAGWGSYMNSSDPGICMYGLSTTGKIQSPTHRVDLIEYIKTKCIPLVELRAATGEDEDSTRVDRAELADLLEYCEGAAVEPVE